VKCWIEYHHQVTANWHSDLPPLLKNPAKTSQGWSPSLVIVGLSGWF